METVLLYAFGLVFVALGIGASIALHEIGHLVPAKRFGVKVTQYMVGFGPTLWSRHRGETEYGIKAIPLGGYIRMIGMFPPRPGDAPGQVRVSSTGRFSQLADEARTASMEEIRPGDEHRVFYHLSVPKKVVVMMGGPLMNLLIAVVLLTGIVTLYGVAVPKDGAVVAAVSECVVPASKAQTQTTCAGADPRTPAYLAGLRPGDKVLTVAGEPVKRTTDIGRLVRPRVGVVTPITVERDGRQVSVQATPIRNQLPVLTADGTPQLDPDGNPIYHETGFLGITSAPVVAIEQQPVTVVPGVVGSALAQTAGVVLRIPQKMVDVAEAAFGSSERDPNGPISVVGVGRIAGEVTSGQVEGFGGTPGAKLAFLVQLIAGLNLALFVFNMIPLLPLDGGHVAGALWEALKRGAARVMNRPDPGPVDVAKALPLAYAVSMALIVMSVLLIYADIVKPIKLG